MSLRSRLIVQFTLGVFITAAVLFVPAGTLDFWEAWVYLAIFFLPMLVFCVYFYKHDPATLERRMQRRERVKEQRWIVRMLTLLFVLGMIAPGLDHRFGWTRRWVGEVPLWLELLAQVLVFVSYVGSMWVVDVNRFASRTIRVEEGQKVISGGPYGVVRHPMYAFFLLLWLATAPALGSYVALPFLAMLIPVMVLRLLNEEKVLRKELPGYIEYTQRTRARLIPYVW